MGLGERHSDQDHVLRLASHFDTTWSYCLCLACSPCLYQHLPHPSRPFSWCLLQLFPWFLLDSSTPLSSER